MEPRLTTRLEFDPRAEIEIGDAAVAYEATRPGYGRLFLNELDHAMALLTSAPRLFQRIDGPIRRAVLRRFPYNLYYYVPADRDIVRVIGCKPGRANPTQILAELGDRIR